MWSSADGCRCASIGAHQALRRVSEYCTTNEFLGASPDHTDEWGHQHATAVNDPEETGGKGALRRPSRRRTMSTTSPCASNASLHADSTRSPWAVSSSQYHRRKNSPYGICQLPFCSLKKPVSCGLPLYLQDGGGWELLAPVATRERRRSRSNGAGSGGR